MKRIFPALFAVAIIAAASPAAAGDYTLGDLTIAQPWARASAGAAANGAAFMEISTTGSASDQLLGASSPVAAKVELHTHLMDGGVMRMREVPAIEVKPGEPAMLKPGGLHVMLIGLKAPFKQGETFPLTLTFEKAGTVTVNVDVEAPGAGAPSGMGHDMGSMGKPRH